MSMPNIPNITPHISLTLEETITLLLSSIAMEEMALAHIMNAEAEKLQYVLGTLFDDHHHHGASIDDVMAVNRSVLKMMNTVTLKEVLLQMKFANIIDLMDDRYVPPHPVSPDDSDKGGFHHYHQE